MKNIALPTTMHKKTKEGNMKKIFLTSGIVACMACPAFADVSGYGFTDTSIDRAANGDLSANTSNTGNTVTDYAQISAHDVANACVIDIIGVTEGETTLRAKWESNYCKYNLDTNTATNGWNGSSSVAPTPIYGVNGDSTHMYTSTDSNGTLTGEKVVTDAILTSSPIGADVTYIPTSNYPSYASTSASISTPMPAGIVTAAPRAFDGMYSAATGGTKYIDADGKLLQAGLDAAAQCTGTDPITEYTWYAQYSCGTPTINSDYQTQTNVPTMTGYSVIGWSLTQPQYAATADAETETHLASLVDSNLPSCITADTPIYPVWAPKAYEVSYSCGTTDITGRTISGYNATPVTSNDYPVYFDRTYTFRGADNCTAPTDYSFDGWDCTPSVQGATTTVYAGGQTISYQYDTALVCVARWKPGIVLHWNSNGGTPTSIRDGTCIYGGGVTLPANPTRTGFTFEGWEVVETSGDTPVEANPSNPQP